MCPPRLDRPILALMAYIETVSPEEADGPLRSIYDAAVQRVGRVFGILRVQSPNPGVLRASMQLYQAVMMGPSPLSRVEREAIAVTVSRVNDCFY
jgi:alkylhydroperoxidase family enzyme